MLKTEYANYDGYGKCLRLSADGQTMAVTLDVGPRIIYFALDGEPNLFYEDREDNINESGAFFDEHFGKGAAWHIYGGHRLWRSPEDWSSYYPDNAPVTVEFIEDGARFISEPEWETTRLQKVITVTYTGAEFRVEHSFINRGDKPNICSLWALTVMDKGGTAFFPYTDENTGLLPNRNLVFWSYSDVNDKRLTLLNQGIVLRQDKYANKAIKLGFLNRTGEHYYLNGSQMLSIRTDAARRDGRYPDYSCSTEMYTNKHMLEVETLSELKEIAPGTSAVHVEYWSIKGAAHEKYKAVKAIVDAADNMR